MNWNWLRIVGEVAPLILSATPLAPIAEYVIIGVKAAEGIPGATGQQKLEVVKQIARIGVAAVNTKAGHQKIDPAIADQILADGISAVVGAVNLKSKSKEK